MSVRFHSIACGTKNDPSMLRMMRDSGRLVSVPLEANDLIALIEQASRALRNSIDAEASR